MKRPLVVVHFYHQQVAVRKGLEFQGDRVSNAWILGQVNVAVRCCVDNRGGDG